MPQRKSLLSSKSSVGTRVVTRRRVLFRGVASVIAGGTLGAGLLAIDRAQAVAKVPKSQAGYKDKPQGGSRCDKCLQFQAPAGCKLVDGSISPTGFCNFFAPKPG